MRRRHVEGLEVVPVGLDLRPLRYRVAHGHEQVLELVAGLGHEVTMSPRRTPALDDFGQVEPLRLDAELPLAGGELLGPPGDRRLDAGTGRVDGPAGVASRLQL